MPTNVASTLVHQPVQWPAEPTEKALEAGFMAYIDLSGLSNTGFCPDCHSLSLYHQGPAPEDSAISYYKLFPTDKELVRYWEKRFVDRESSTVDLSTLFPNKYCQYCVMLSESIRRLAPLQQEIPPGITLARRLYLRSGSDIILSYSVKGMDVALIEIYPHRLQDGRHGQRRQTGAPFSVINEAECGFEGLGNPRQEVPKFCGTDTLETLKRHMDECMTHDACRKKDGAQLPTRLIYLGSSEDEIRLIETKDLTGDDTSYAALSHCWGNLQPMKLTSQKLGSYKKQIPSRDLSRLFRDAITVARYFDIRYLWIDVFNIIQDDLDDWAREAGRMSLVYENADLVISATRCVDGSTPFLGPSATNHPNLVRFLINSPDGGAIHADASLYWMGRYSPGGPLSTRGWSFQEAVLARRIVHFTERGFIWQCRKTRAAQRNVFDTTSPHWQLSWATDPTGHWMMLVREYSSRRLTFVTDRLPALSGLATHYCEVFSAEDHKKPDYLAGLWAYEQDFERQLAWMHETSEFERNLGTVPDDFLAPSWSWASVVGGVTWVNLNPPRADHKAQARLVRWSCVGATSNPYGQVQRGTHVVLEGAVIDVVVFAKGHEYFLKSLNQDGSTPTEWKPDYDLTIYDESEPNNLHTSQIVGQEQFSVTKARPSDVKITDVDGLQGRVKLLRLWSTTSRTCGLVLGRPRDTTVEGAFERLGLISTVNKQDLWATLFQDSMEVREMILV